MTGKRRWLLALKLDRRRPIAVARSARQNCLKADEGRLMSWLIGGLFLLNVFATAVICRSAFYDPTKKLLQTAIVWAVPAVGALVVLMAWWSAREDPSRHRVVKELPDELPGSFSQRSAADDD